MKSDKTNPAAKLLKTLNSFPEIRKNYITLYGVSKRLISIYPNSIIFEYISILSYYQEKELLEKLDKIYLGNFFKDISNFKIKAFQCFIDCIEIKRHLDNEYVTEKISDIIGQINSSSLVLKYIKMVAPLIKEKNKNYQTKIKLLVMIPNNFHKLYSEMSTKFPLFPISIIDFYSFNKIKDNTDNFIKYSKENNNAINADDNTENWNDIESLKKEFLSFKNSVKIDIDRIQKENSDIKNRLQMVQTNNKTLFEKCEKLQENIYQINFRDSIKSFLDKLMKSLDIFNYNLSLSMQLFEIKTKLNNISSKLNDNEKKCAYILIDILENFYSENKTDDYLSHFFNNLGFNIENLPQKVKEKYLFYTNGNNDYDDVSLVLSSLNGLISEKQEKVMNSFLKQIISQSIRGNSLDDRKKEIIECIKTHSKLIVA